MSGSGSKTNNNFLRQHFTCWIFIITLLLVYTSASAQGNPVMLSKNEILKPLGLDDSQWKFHAGDNMAWANPTYNDNQWDTIAGTNFGTGKFKWADIPKNWTGFGWFRIWVKKSDAALTNSWGLYLNHDAASEVYFDGKKIMKLGKLGHSAQEMLSVRNPYLTIPLAIIDTLPHLLAIRYCHYENLYPDFIGFNAYVQDLNLMDANQKSSQRFMDYLLMSVAAACILILLHSLLFIFYPKKKINLYYVMFVAIVAMGLYARYQTIISENPALQIWYTKIFMCFVLLHLNIGALLLYAAVYDKMPRWRTIIVTVLSIGLVIWVFIDWYNMCYDPLTSKLTNWYQLAFVAIAYTDIMITTVKAIKKGNKKLWLIAAGIILIILGGIFIGSNQFQWFTLKEVLIFFAWGNLAMPILFSVYIALDVAATNRSLEQQLDENKKLTDENIAQEKEKNRLITAQAAELEKTVLERTAQVREQADRLREMDAAKSRFFVNLTHEFKTPLTLIMNPARELLTQQDPEVTKEYAAYILENSDRLLQLINQLLDLSRLEAGEITVTEDPIDAVNWLKRHVSQYHSLAEHKGVTLQFNANIERLLILADKDKLEKIAQNLISNAIKFSHGGGLVTVSLKQMPDHEFSITITDEGVGINDQKVPYIFDRFYQADSSDTRTREGAGIGLALVKELVQVLKGHITVESVMGKGSTFRVTLPYKPVDEIIASETMDDNIGDLENEIEELELINIDTNQKAPVVLVVEDNEQLRHFMQISLKPDYHILTAADGTAGIESALEHMPNLIITDLMMPQMNGYELCTTLKEDQRTSHIPIIMLTAKTDRDSRIHGIEIGADAYLPKPFDNEELEAVIKNLINMREQLREKYSRQLRWFTHTEELPSLEKSFLDQLRNIIEENLDDSQMSTDWLARKIGMSRTQLHRKLKDLIGQGPGELVRTIRMQKAHQLLQKGNATVAEVSYQVGYANPFNFSTAFSNHFGYPPSEVSKI